MAYALTNSDNTLVTLVSLGKPQALTSPRVIISKDILFNRYWGDFVVIKNAHVSNINTQV